jgi:hypothetical protein
LHVISLTTPLTLTLSVSLLVISISLLFFLSLSLSLFFKLFLRFTTQEEAAQAWLDSSGSAESFFEFTLESDDTLRALGEKVELIVSKQIFPDGLQVLVIFSENTLYLVLQGWEGRDDLLGGTYTPSSSSVAGRFLSEATKPLPDGSVPLLESRFPGTILLHLLPTIYIYIYIILLS